MPPAAFFEAYADVAANGNGEQKTAGIENALRAGWNQTHAHFRKLVDSPRVFETAYDGVLFARSPAATWSSKYSWQPVCVQ